MKFFAIFIITICTFTQFILPSFAQNNERKKPELKDFGSSLNQQPAENLAPPKSKKSTQKDDDVIQIDTDLVVVDYLVIDKKGAGIYGLKKEDFIVTEDGQPQEIQTFTLGDDAKIPRSIVLIIDYSGSQLPYIERSVEAAKLLVDKLRPNDLMAVVTDDVELIAQFTSDKKLLKDQLELLKANALENKKFGKSLQFSSLYAVLNEMFDEEDVRPIILFQTDGDQFQSLKGGLFQITMPTSPALLERLPNFSFNDLLKLTEKSRATIYTIVPGIKRLGLSPQEKLEKSKIEAENNRKLMEQFLGNRPPSPSRPPTPEMAEIMKKRAEFIRQKYPNGLPDIQEVLAGLSKYSGGWIDFLEKPEDANGVYSRILSQLNTRYIIGYSPTNGAKDGKRRVVKIAVKNHPEYIVWGRKTYIAPLAN